MSTTESFSNYDNLEKKTTADLLRIINNEDKTVPLSIKKSLKEISVLIDKIFERMVEGGRLFKYLVMVYRRAAYCSSSLFNLTIVQL